MLGNAYTVFLVFMSTFVVGMNIPITDEENKLQRLQ